MARGALKLLRQPKSYCSMFLSLKMSLLAKDNLHNLHLPYKKHKAQFDQKAVDQNSNQVVLVPQ